MHTPGRETSFSLANSLVCVIEKNLIMDKYNVFN